MSDPAAPRRPPWKHPLLKRLPLMLVAVVGLWLWHSRGQERQILWQLSPARRVTVLKMEVQLRDAEGKILKREEFDFPEGAPTEVLQTARLKDGNYEAWVFLTPKVPGPTITLQQRVEVEGDTVIEPLP